MLPRGQAIRCQEKEKCRCNSWSSKTHLGISTCIVSDRFPQAIGGYAHLISVILEHFECKNLVLLCNGKHGGSTAAAKVTANSKMRPLRWKIIGSFWASFLETMPFCCFIHYSLFLFACLFFETNSHVDQATLKFTVFPKMIRNSWLSCLHTSSTGITSVKYPAWLDVVFFNFSREHW